MTTPKKPEQIIPESIRKGLEGIWRGWTRPVEALLDQLSADVTGLEQRLSNRVGKGEPGCYRSIKLFKPSSGTTTFPDYSLLVNHIVRAGTMYELSTIFPGPGVFVVDSLRVHCYQRIYNPNVGECWQLMSQNGVQQFGNTVTTYARPYGGIAITNSGIGTIANPGTQYINFLWNVIDTRSSRYLANDLMPDTALCPRFGIPSAVASQTDGDWFKFDTPWLVERDGQLTLHFYPVVDIVQIDSSLALNAAHAGVTPMPFDDRQGGVRDQSVAVQVEYHGYRFKTDQDAIRSGALVHADY